MNSGVLTQLLAVNPAVSKLAHKQTVLSQKGGRTCQGLVHAWLPCPETTSRECALHTCSRRTPIALALKRWNRGGHGLNEAAAPSN